MNRKKTILILPALNAEKTLLSFLKSLPKDLFDEIILVDDCSTDKTYKLAKKQKFLTVFRNPRNLGYGGNLKVCLTTVLEHGADIIIELHPDGEYLPDGIVPALEEAQKGAALVLGNRFFQRKMKNEKIKTTTQIFKIQNLFSFYILHFTLPNGMFWWKFICIKIVNTIHNWILGTQISDLHQGFRVYTKRLLTQVNWKEFSNDYLFSFEIILAALEKKLPISSIPVTTRYQGKKRGASFRSSLVYTIQTFWIILKSWLKSQRVIPTKHEVRMEGSHSTQRLGGVRFLDYADASLGMTVNNFTHPLPKDIRQYYPLTYWQYQGIVGLIRKYAFRFFQKRRVRWVTSYLPKGAVLDVGSGEGIFGTQLGRGYEVTNLEAPFAQIKNKNILKEDFLQWTPKRLFDTVTFWESLEHVPDPEVYLKKTHALLKDDSIIFIEYPRNDVWEQKMFGKFWFHLDILRHVTHFSEESLIQLLTKVGFRIVEKRSVLAIEYAPGGLYLSLINGLRQTPALSTNVYNKPVTYILLPLFPFCVLFEILLYCLGQSPIGLIVAKKR